MAGLLGPVGGAAADAGKDAIEAWLNEARISNLLNTLFHQTILDGKGQVRTENYEAAGISFTLTQLNLHGLVEHPIYHVEATNLTLPADNLSRVRYFVYDSASYQLWRETPTDSWLRPPNGWPVVCPKQKIPWKSVFAIDREVVDTGVKWFRRTYSPGEKVLLSAGTISGGLAVANDRRQDKRAMKRIEGLLHQHCSQGEYHIPPERYRLDTEELSFWLTPLRSAMSEQAVLYYLVVLNIRLSLHPKRAVAFMYSVATKKLQWM